jgi:hypothetical protein
MVHPVVPVSVANIELFGSFFVMDGVDVDKKKDCTLLYEHAIIKRIQNDIIIVQNCVAVNIPLAQLSAFASKPLSPINVDAFVRFLSRTESRLPHVSPQVPFDISGDRATMTHSV